MQTCLLCKAQPHLQLGMIVLALVVVEVILVAAEDEIDHFRRSGDLHVAKVPVAGALLERPVDAPRGGVARHGPHGALPHGDNIFRRVGQLDHESRRNATLAAACQIFPLPISRYRFKFQSELGWDSIKSISNFCFQFEQTR